MKKHMFVVLLGLIISLLLVTACSGSSPASTQALAGLVGDAKAGKAVYNQTCVSCHGADGKGRVGLGKNLVTSEFVKSKTDADLVAFIEAGRLASDPANTTGVDMPKKGGNPTLTDQDLANVVAYIRTLQ